MEISAKLIRRGSLLFLILDHDKGRSVFTEYAGGWIPTDKESSGAIKDLKPDVPDEGEIPT